MSKKDPIDSKTGRKIITENRPLIPGYREKQKSKKKRQKRGKRRNKAKKGGHL